ncbi:hypothetical protein CU254_05415 [Amycolatopsis sp. AA4]|uniref:hypothetical protein n=1 Tax=Actinomycetes TaxID=1760 RepID=UPI0001DEE07A|nr:MULTISPECIES: hypothetical protein [Actinomycetes]ATY09962.1 hypothetical protein CU254_05415 [Amycolatopsis sp. AA4]EFL05381.1 hypothetical protein SSMG_01052 [Streptomyces sp. AA4]
MSTSGGPQEQPGTPQEPGAVPPGWQAPPPGAGHQPGYPQQPGQAPQYGQQQYPGQPAPGAYPGQAGQPGQYPGQPGQYAGQPGQPGQYPGQAAYPGQQGYPAQPPGYPAPQPGYPAQPPGAGYAAPQSGPGFLPQNQPLTTPGLGAIPVVLGAILEVVALFIPWVTFTLGSQTASVTFIDAFGKMTSGMDSFAAMYVRFLAFILIAATLGSTLPWTLGALRGKKSAYWLSGIRSRELTPPNFWWYRTVFAGRATLMLIFHIAGIVAMFSEDLSKIGLGAYLLLLGGVLVVVGAAIGPKLTAAR